MISIDPLLQGERDNYKLLVGSIIPRPIAWTTTLSSNGVVNAAPFSYFNIVASSPPMVSVSVARRDGQMKDTARNARDTGAFVVHIVDEENVGLANETAAFLGPEESETEKVGLVLVPSEAVNVPGLAAAKIRMECTVEHLLPMGDTGTGASSDLLIGRVVRFHVAEELYHEGRIDPQLLKPVSRLAGSSYGKLGELFDLTRP
jgi:flavin reductase (DIM6/NTAB) family NADH-FMN oxidoreductase RutF